MRKDMKNVLPDPFKKIHFKIPGHEYRKKKKKSVHMQGLLHSLTYLWNQKLVDIPLSYEMFLLAHHEKKKKN